MDMVERFAKRYLESLKLGEVLYEPDGNVPPDFMIDGRIAVEVTRLDRTLETRHGFVGLKSDEEAVSRMLRNLLPRFGAGRNGQGWWVSCRFRRPFDKKLVKRTLPAVLQDVAANSIGGKLEIEIAQNFSLALYPTEEDTSYLFTLATYSDFASGWPLEQLIRSYNLRLAEKAQKVAKFRPRYSEWWLVFVDLITASFGDDDRSRIIPHLDAAAFDKLVLLHPQKPLCGFEMPTVGFSRA